MPKLHGYRQRSYFNTWDAFNLREFRERRAELKARGIEGDGTDLPIYGNQNVGNLHLTNLASAGGIGGMPDATKFIRHWYGRTNIGLELTTDAAMTAWLAWTHATTVTMTMGCMPVAQLSLSDLLSRRLDERTEFGAMCAHRDVCAGDCGKHLLVLAERMFGAHMSSPQDRDSYTANWEWNGLAPADQQKWIAAAREAERLFQASGPIILPVRQSFSVNVYTEPRALSALLEVMPTNIAPRVLVWVHVEGVAQIDAG